MKSLDCTDTFRIKDLMLGELLCQAGIVDDLRLLEITRLAKAARSSIGSLLVVSKTLTASELFQARRLVNRYIADSDNADYYVNTLARLIHPANSHTPRTLSSRLPKQLIGCGVA